MSAGDRYRTRLGVAHNPRHPHTGQYRAKHAAPVDATEPRERKQKRTCSAMRQGDEVHCHCGVFWSLTEDRPECPYGGSY